MDSRSKEAEVGDAEKNGRKRVQACWCSQTSYRTIDTSLSSQLQLRSLHQDDLLLINAPRAALCTLFGKALV